VLKREEFSHLATRGEKKELEGRKRYYKTGYIDRFMLRKQR
jgi:hypothetical protein